MWNANWHLYGNILTKSDYNVKFDKIQGWKKNHNQVIEQDWIAVEQTTRKLNVICFLLSLANPKKQNKARNINDETWVLHVCPLNVWRNSIWLIVSEKSDIFRTATLFWTLDQMNASGAFIWLWICRVNTSV